MKRLKVSNAYDESVVEELPSAGEPERERAIERARAHLRAHPRGLPIGERLVVLERFARSLRERREELAAIAVVEGGKPIVDTRIEVDRAIAGVESAAAALRAGETRATPLEWQPGVRGHRAFVERRPIGVVAALSAFNHPINLVIHQAIPAFAAGCPVIVKPSEKTPRSAIFLEHLARECGAPPDAWQTLVTEDVAVARALAIDPRIAFVSFVGSAAVGWKLRSELAPGTRCALEHGGVASSVLLDDVDLDAVLPSVVRGAFHHAGQVCVSTQRLVVPQGRLAEVVDRLVVLTRALTVGDPRDPSTDVGPLIRPREVDRVARCVDEARASGAVLATGGRRLGRTCYEPTILVGPPPGSAVRDEEIFGPVLVVLPYREPTEAVALANHPRFSFQASVFGRDVDSVFRTADELDASTVLINDHTAFRVDDAPFVGLRESGLGVGGIPFTLREMQVERRTILRVASG